jgi:restriction endonuclease S subunit
LISDKLKGATIQHVGKRDIETIEIPIIPIEEQEKIIKQIEDIYNSIKLAEDLIKSLKARGGILQSLWGNSKYCNETK